MVCISILNNKNIFFIYLAKKFCNILNLNLKIMKEICSAHIRGINMIKFI